MTTPKFQIGDYVMIDLSTRHNGKNLWIAIITNFEGHCYTVKNLSYEVEFETKVPILLEKLMKKIETEDVNKSLKTIKILYPWSNAK